MNKQSARFFELLDSIKELHDKKRHDYGANEDVFANFRLSELSGIPAWQGSVVRMGDKYARISNFIKKNDFKFKDSGIEQTWNFAHPNNKKVTGPLGNFKRMLKGDSYQMMIDHLSHTITQLGSTDKWAQFEVIILDKSKIYHKFNWQVEKYTEDGELKDCWLTTMVSNPIPLGSSI